MSSKRVQSRLAHAEGCLAVARALLKEEVADEEKLIAAASSLRLTQEVSKRSSVLSELTYLRAAARGFMEELDILVERSALRVDVEREVLQEQCDTLAKQRDDLEVTERRLAKRCRLMEEEVDHCREEQEQAMTTLREQIDHLEQERAALARDRDDLIVEQSSLQRQLEDEREKLLCGICQDKPRDTFVLPCMHFQYCFACLTKHRDTSNRNTCPTCRGSIQGLCMSSSLSNP